MEKTETIKFKGLKISVECESFEYSRSNDGKESDLAGRIRSLEILRGIADSDFKKILEVISEIQKKLSDKK